MSDLGLWTNEFGFAGTSTGTSQLEVIVQSSDPDALAKATDQARQAMADTSGIEDVTSSLADSAPRIDIDHGNVIKAESGFKTRPFDRILREVGIDANQAAPDPVAMRAAFLVDSDTETLTFRDLQARRDEVREKMQARRRRSRRGAAATRRTRSGAIHGANQQISLSEGLAAETINAARMLKREDVVGSIEVGKFADFVELSADPYMVDVLTLAQDCTVLGTWLGGRRVDLDSFISMGHTIPADEHKDLHKHAAHRC